MRNLLLLSIVLLAAVAQADPILDCLNQAAVRRASPKAKPTMEYRLAAESELTNRCDEQGDLNAIKHALRYQVERCRTFDVNDKPKMKLACRMFDRNEWCAQTSQRMLEIANTSPNIKTYLNRIRAEFDWYKSLGLPDATTDGRFARGDVQFTGYFSPLIKASRTRTGAYQYPVYSVPPDLVEIPDSSPANCGMSIHGRPNKWCRKNPNGTYSPYFSRKEIEAGALRGKGLEIAYVTNPIELDSMMIQGSATLELQGPGGTKQLIHANFGAKNGRTLRMIGSVLKCAGARGSEYSSMAGIEAYLRADAARAKKLLSYDQSYVFFREQADGPYGSEKIPVTGRHSVAVDRTLVPPGASTLIDVSKFGAAKGSCPRISTFAMAQDTGGAIRGAHVDWYFGAGSAAGSVAGKMNNAGSFYVAVPHGAGRPIQGCK